MFYLALAQYCTRLSRCQIFTVVTIINLVTTAVSSIDKTAQP